MANDIWTILWRDLRGYRAQFEDPKRLILGVCASVILLIVAELLVGVHGIITSARPVLLIWIWCWLPLGSAVTLSTDAIAGERERHTLESLLATRIPVRALLIGKTLSITIQSWISAFLLALGALAAINLATAWHGDFVIFPWSVLLFGPIVSFLITLLGTLVAFLFSMGAPTVRQANFRVVVVTTMLPVVVMIPLAILLFVAVAMLALLVQFTSLQLDREMFSLNSTTIAAAIFLAAAGLIGTIGITYLITSYRFTRERLIRVGSASSSFRPDRTDHNDISYAIPRFGFDRAGQSVVNQQDSETTAFHGNRIKTILEDAWVVTWKELTEAKGLVREWRGWLFVIGFVALSMIVQLSAVVSWYWEKDADTSLIFWFAMAAAMPLLIAQRSADSIAGERERHTGEILFTTRLSHSGILLGKLGATALLPWTLLLAIPTIGVILTNLIHSSAGPYFYPPKVLAAGVGLTLGVAFFFAAAGMLVSMGAPTVQHAARRISWFLMPVLIAPGLLVRSSLWPATIEGDSGIQADGIIEVAASGNLATYVLVVVPLLALLSGILICLLFNRFQRGTVVFD
jgi:ABC-2 type transport system permease protein